MDGHLQIGISRGNCLFASNQRYFEAITQLIPPEIIVFFITYVVCVCVSVHTCVYSYTPWLVLEEVASLLLLCRA